MEFITSFEENFESFIGVNFWTLLFAWINILILYLFLKKLLWKPVKNMIDSRQAEIDNLYADAEKSKTDAAALKDEYEVKMAGAHEESEEILRRAVKKAQLREEEILHDADEKAARTLERAEEQIEREKKQAINDVKNQVSGMAIDIAEAVIGRDVKPEEHAAMIDSFIDKLGEEK